MLLHVPRHMHARLAYCGGSLLVTAAMDMCDPPEVALGAGLTDSGPEGADGTVCVSSLVSM